MAIFRRHAAHRQPIFIGLACVESNGYPDWEEGCGAYVNIAWAAPSLEVAEEVLRKRLSENLFRMTELHDLQRFDPKDFADDDEFVRLADEACHTGFEWGTFHTFPLDSEE